MAIPRPEHPNPQWERKTWRNLNGTWQFEIDHGVSGEARGLPAAPSLSGKITVPFCPESRLSGVGNKDFMRCVWYKRSISLTRKDLAGQRVILHIGACDFETHVFINGEEAGQPHFGGYGSFQYEITKFVKPGKNDVTIEAIDDIQSLVQPHGKQSAKYDSYRCYYTRTTGIWQTVWLEFVPESFIAYARFDPDVENGTVAVTADLAGTGDFSVEVYYKGKLMGKAEKKNCAVRACVDIKLKEKHLWEIGHGRLYDLILRFGADEVKSYFGLRSVRMDGMKFLLNGKSVFQRLILDQGFYPDGICTAPTEADLVKDIDCGIAAGFEGARMHQKVFEPRYLYHADKKGYIVWGEYGSWGTDTSERSAVSYFLPDWISTVLRDVNHPSVIGWCPFNETWNTREGKISKSLETEVLRIIYEETKRVDPTRPCIDTSGNYHVVTDIFDVHLYEQDPAIFKETYDKLWQTGELVDRYKERQTYRGEPVFVSEYGGIGFKLESNDYDSGRKTQWSYGKSAGSYEEFYDRYKRLTHAIIDNPCMFGLCYTQLTDVEQEQNGLFTYDTREPKFDLKILKKIMKKKAAIEK